MSLQSLLITWRYISWSQTDDQNSIPCWDTSSQFDLIADIEIFKEKWNDESH